MTAIDAESLAEALDQTTAFVFETMLGARVDARPAAGLPDRARSITAAVHYTGSWRGVLLLECDSAAALALTRLMLGEEPPDWDGAVCDALAELVSMIGGNLRFHLPPGAQLSVPSIVRGFRYSPWLCGKGERVRRAYRSGSTELCITVLESPGAAG